MADKNDIGAENSANNPLVKKLNKILELRIENDKDTLEALKSLSTYFTDNNLRSRRNLRGDIERRSLGINEEFAECFRSLTEQLDSVFEYVNSMNDCCQDMTTRLKAAKQQTQGLISQTTQLQAQSQKLQLRSQIADVFLSKFQLKPEEAAALRGARDGALPLAFFDSLARVRQIHGDCKVLLRTNQQTAGLEIMESMALHQESAYERLYRWVQNECRMLSGDTLDISNQLCLAMEALQDRPVLFRYTLDEFGTARRTAIVRGFIDALTRGGPGGTPRPIELNSHDPLRYVGDMMAWLHQAVVSEKEHLQTLLRRCSAKVIEEHILDVMSHITDGVCTSLKMRQEQVLVSEPGPVVLYKLTNLVKFYHFTLRQQLESRANLLTTLEDIYVLSLRMFFNSLSSHASKLLDKVEVPPSDLSPTSTLRHSLQLLQDILSSHSSSVGLPDERKQDFAKILSCTIDPLNQLCSMSAMALPTIDMATYMINCLHQIHTTLSLYEYTDQWLEMLQAQTDAHVDTLVSEQAGFILNKAGLASVYAMIQQHQPAQGALATLHGMDAKSVKSAMSQFDTYLSSPDSLILPQCSMLLSAKIKDTIKQRAVELICQAYGLIFAAINNKNSGYTDLQSLIPRTPDQVKSLLTS